MSQLLHFKGFAIDPASRQVLVGGVPRSIGSRAFDVLLALAERRERLVSKGELLDLVWPDVVVEENNLQVQVSALRHLLGRDSITTVPGRGYCLTASRPDEAATMAGSVPAAELRTNLPTLLPTLLGRGEDLNVVNRLIENNSLVTVVGAGGIGKSLLAQHLLGYRSRSHSHGVCWVEFGSISDRALICSTISSALGVVPTSGDLLAALCAALSTLDVLLALDNVEHLTLEIGAVITAVLASAPKVRFLVTTQARLNLAAEHMFRMGPLSVPNGPVGLESARSYGAIALFEERARSADARFALTETNVASVIDLCRRLDGLPLAIELAAARAPTLGLMKLLQSMDRRLDLLSSHTNRDAPSRQQTLRASLDWSYGLLNEREQVVFRQMAVFSGSASMGVILDTLVAPERDANEWDNVDTLAALVDRSLVAIAPTNNGSTLRYRLLDSPRAYALEKLEKSGETEKTRERHALRVAQFFEAAEEERFGGGIGVGEWLDQMALDVDNARAAIVWARGTGNKLLELRLLLGLIQALPTSLHQQRLELAERTAELVGDAMPARLQCRAWSAFSRICLNRYPKRSHEAAVRALRLARTLSNDDADRFLLYRALCDLVRSPERLDRDDGRSVLLDEARDIERSAWPPHKLVWRARAAAFFAASMVDMNECIRINRRVVELDRSSGASTSLAMCDLIDAQLAAGDAEGAVDAGEKLVDALHGTRSDRTLAYAQLNLVAALLETGDTQRAEVIGRQGWASASRFELQPYWADYLSLLAVLQARPKAAAVLAGFADHGYGLREQGRAHNELQAMQRTRSLVVDSIGESAVKHFFEVGKSISCDEVADLAFSQQDLS